MKPAALCLKLWRGDTISTPSSRTRLFYRPVTENSGLAFSFNSYASWVRGEKGGWVHRKTLSGSGLSFNCNLCKCCALLFTADIWLLCSGNMTAVIYCQTSTILVLDTILNKTDYISHKIIQCKMKKPCVWWNTQAYLVKQCHVTTCAWNFIYLSCMLIWQE